MKHILANPQNGAPVDHLGVKLAHGHEVVVPEIVGEELALRFNFLLLRIVPGSAVTKVGKPSKIKGTLSWNTETHPDPDVPDFAQHTHAPARAAKKTSEKKGGKK